MQLLPDFGDNRSQDVCLGAGPAQVRESPHGGGCWGVAGEAVTRASDLKRASRAAQLCFPYAIENSDDGSLEFGWIIVIPKQDMLQKLIFNSVMFWRQA